VHLAYICIICHLSAKNYQNRWKFDAVLTKTNLLSFLGHGVLPIFGPALSMVLFKFLPCRPTLLWQRILGQNWL